jgi:hypothetical protein
MSVKVGHAVGGMAQALRWNIAVVKASPTVRAPRLHEDVDRGRSVSVEDARGVALPDQADLVLAL